MKLSGQEVEKKLLATNYIDAKLKGKQRKVSIPFCSRIVFLKNFNTWLKGMEGDVPQSPSDLDFWFHDISIKGIGINSVYLYQCKMIIPMMDCQLTCKSIVIDKS